MEKFKCANCGSSKYVQTKHDELACEYCGSKFNVENTIKDFFISDLSKIKNRNNVKFVSANVTEQEFYKNALAYLAVNKNSPKDILTANFSHVKYRYVFFAVFDLHLSLDSCFSGPEGVSKHSHYLSTKTMCVKLTEDCISKQSSLILNSYDKLYENSTFSTPALKGVKLSYPSKKDADATIEAAVEDYKKKNNAYILREKQTSLNAYSAQSAYNSQVAHKVSKLQILAVPEYSLEYTYQNKTHTLYSFAHDLNIVGDVVKCDELKTKLNKALMPLTISNLLFGVPTALFSLYGLLIRRLLKFSNVFKMLFIISLVFAFASFAITVCVQSIQENKVFELKKEQFLKYAEQNQIEITQKDISYINLLKGGY